MPWYLPTLGTTLLAIQGVSIWRTPSEELPPPVMEDVVFAAPPKPETQRDTDADGSVESYTWERCRAIPASYQDECFGALARQLAPTDPEGGLLACEEIAKRPRRLECMADVAEGYAPSDRDFSLSMCTTIPARKWRDQCVFGIAMAYVAKQHAQFGNRLTLPRGRKSLAAEVVKGPFYRRNS